jgi:hypothetical protein
LVAVTPNITSDLTQALEVTAAGVDTWKLVWKVPVTQVVATERGFGDRRVLPGKVAGHAIGYERDRWLLWAEGHPAEAIGAAGKLCPAVRLAEARRAVEEALWAAGVEVPAGRVQGGAAGLDLSERDLSASGFAGVGRLDTTVDLKFARPVVGVAVLEASRTALRGSDRRLDVQERTGAGGHTVWLASSRGHVGRMYDKGLETREATAGRWLRLEAQDRASGGSRRPIEELSPAYLQGRIRRRFRALGASERPVKALDSYGLLVDRVEADVRAGRLTTNEGSNVIALLVAEAAGRRSHLKKRTAERTRRLIGELGLRFDPEPVVADLRSVYGAAVETARWSAEAVA